MSFRFSYVSEVIFVLFLIRFRKYFRFLIKMAIFCINLELQVLGRASLIDLLGSLLILWQFIYIYIRLAYFRLSVCKQQAAQFIFYINQYLCICISEHNFFRKVLKFYILYQEFISNFFLCTFLKDGINIYSFNQVYVNLISLP